LQPVHFHRILRMLRLIDVQLPLDHPEPALKQAVLARLGIDEVALLGYTVFRRSYDARRKSAVTLIYTVDVELSDEATVLRQHAGDRTLLPTPDTNYHYVTQAPAGFTNRPVVIGMGPCGLFAGLILAQMGFRPIILERGKSVRERTKDTFGLWRKRVLHPESNVQFGEGGAGTFSDGKLWTQVKDPKHYGRKVLTEFVKADAPPEILYVSKPHIGTFRLVKMVELMRSTIEALGGEIRFETRVTDMEIDNDRMQALHLSTGERLEADHVVLAVGHSARDTFQMLYDRGVHVEAKPFSIGFRIEHPQGLIDRCRFGPSAGNPILGAADYKLVHHCGNGRSVYSFCMCPGGTVVAATSEPGRVVTNGMSQYSRNERNANAGIVVGITPDDYPGHPLAGIEFQRQWEPARHGAAVLQAGREARRPRERLARLRDHGAAGGSSGVRPPDPRLRDERCGADRRGNPHLVADPHPPRRRQPAEHQHPRPVSGRRGRRLRGRHHVGGDRRHTGGRGGRPEHGREVTLDSGGLRGALAAAPAAPSVAVAGYSQPDLRKRRYRYRQVPTIVASATG
jgi:uncharacterized FAD-dependent dehydrogenase